MITFLFILIILLLIIIINYLIRNDNKNLALTNKLTRIVAIIGLSILIIGITIINFCSYFKTEEKLSKELEIQQVNKIEEVTKIENESNSSIQSNKLISIKYINSDENVNPCIISKDIIKQKLQNPSTAEFSKFDCSSEKNSDGTYTILRKVSAKNLYGVEKEFIYKLRLGFKGGSWTDLNNWDLIKIQSQEYR